MKFILDAYHISDPWSVAEYADCTGGFVLSWDSVCAYVPVFIWVLVFKYSLCHDQLYADGFIWGYRKSRQCGFTCYAGCGNRWNK